MRLCSCNGMVGPTFPGQIPKTTGTLVHVHVVTVECQLFNMSEPDPLRIRMFQVLQEVDGTGAELHSHQDEFWLFRYKSSHDFRTSALPV